MNTKSPKSRGVTTLCLFFKKIIIITIISFWERGRVESFIECDMILKIIILKHKVFNHNKKLMGLNGLDTGPLEGSQNVSQSSKLGDFTINFWKSSKNNGCYFMM